MVPVHEAVSVSGIEDKGTPKTPVAKTAKIAKTGEYEKSLLRPAMSETVCSRKLCDGRVRVYRKQTHRKVYPPNRVMVEVLGRYNTLLCCESYDEFVRRQYAPVLIKYVPRTPCRAQLESCGVDRSAY